MKRKKTAFGVLSAILDALIMLPEVYEIGDITKDELIAVLNKSVSILSGAIAQNVENNV